MNKSLPVRRHVNHPVFQVRMSVEFMKVREIIGSRSPDWRSDENLAGVDENRINTN